MKKRIQTKPVLVVFLVVIAAVAVYSMLLKPSLIDYSCIIGSCSTVEKDRAIAENYIVSSIQYREFGGSSLVEKNFSSIAGGHEFSYYFESSSQNIRGFDVVISVESGSVESSSFIEILKEGFCGRSTMSYCVNDLDCVKGGCSGSICQAKADEQVLTTCEYKECYSAEIYGLSCRCTEGKCQWA